MKFLRKYLLALAVAFLPLAGLAESIDPSVQGCANAYGDLLTVESRPAGPHLYLSAASTGLRDFDSISELKVGQYNVENMYNYLGKWTTDPVSGRRVMIQAPKPKPQNRWESLRDVIQRSDDDIMVWEEVEDMAAAQDFIDTKLSGQYRPILIKGNDQRGIDIAIFVKKDLPFDIEIQSHIHIPDPAANNPIFSRDLPVVSIRRAGANREDKPLAEFIGTHFKSQRDSPGDPGGLAKRTRQVEVAAKIVREFEKARPGVPIFFLGDFNSDIRSASEFQPLWEIGLKDSFDLAPNPLPKDQRITQSFFPRGGKAIHSQLDGILVNKAGQDMQVVKTAEIVPYRNPDGSEMPIPQSHADREAQGSDHRKLKVLLDFTKMKKAWAATN